MDLSLLPKVDRVILALEGEDYNSLLLAESAREGVDRLRRQLRSHLLERGIDT